MEDIEYLEEYEDLVLPALNSAAAAAAASSTSFQVNKNSRSQKINEDTDDSSSSLDQDIFNCLFDDNSDDDDFNNDENIGKESAQKSKAGSRESFDDLEEKIEELGEKVLEKVEISRQVATNSFKTDTVTNITATNPKQKTFMTKTSGTTVPLNTRPQTSLNKTKSIATVRPTVQNQKQEVGLQKTNLSQRTATAAAAPTSTTSTVQRQNPSTSAPSTSARSVQLPILVSKQSPSSASLPSNSGLVAKRPETSLSVPGSAIVIKKISGKRQATIIKPEKIITKDPANDPLELDDFSEAGTNNSSSSSDISGETYNSVSNFEEDESFDEFYSGDDFEDYDDVSDEEAISSSSHIIELSNDSSSAVSNLKDLRAPTPSPVISDDNETSSSSGLKIRTAKFVKPYSHPDIIQSILRKGEKPCLYELLCMYNLLDDPTEHDQEDTIIDITTSRENLVETLDTPQVESASLNINNSLASTTALTIDSSSDLNTTDKNKLLTSNPSDKNQTYNSKKTNKNKSKKKSVTNMEDISTDSDLSAVEELLEESYAEAMKKVKNEPLTTNQELGSIIEISGDEVPAKVEDKQKLPKPGVVIDYDDLQVDDNTDKANKIEQKDTGQKELEIKGADKNNDEPEELKQLPIIATTNDREADNAKKTNDPSELADVSLQQSEIVKENVDNVAATSNEVAQLLEDGVDITSCNSPSNKKKKRFRNLLTPDPTQSETTKSIDDIKDFKGFEEEHEQTSEYLEGVVIQDKATTTSNTQKKEIQEKKITKIDKIAEKDRSSGSFKSPHSSHQSLTDKSREHKEKRSRDDSKESKHKRSHYSSSKSSGDSSRDRSSRESSRDKSSRESSRDRSRDRSKDRSTYSHGKDSFNKHHHHRDHRKSSDSKDSSKSRDSSKSDDSKYSRRTKTESQDSSKSKSTKKEKLSEKKDIKTTTSIDKSSESKVSREAEVKKDSSKDYKKSSEKMDKKSVETEQKSKEKHTEKSGATATHDSKGVTPKDVLKSTSSSSKSDSNISRDSSKERSSSIKTKDITKSSSESKKLDHSKNSKPSTDLNKSVGNKSSLKTNDKPISKSLPVENAPATLQESSESAIESKSIKTTTKNKNDESSSLKDTTEKKMTENPDLNTSQTSSKINESNKKSTDLNTSQTPSKSSEGDKKIFDLNISKPSSKSDKKSIDSNTSKASTIEGDKNTIDANMSKASSKTIASDKKSIDSNTTKPSSKNIESDKSEAAPKSIDSEKKIVDSNTAKDAKASSRSIESDKKSVDTNTSTAASKSIESEKKIIDSNTAKTSSKNIESDKSKAASKSIDSDKKSVDSNTSKPSSKSDKKSIDSNTSKASSKTIESDKRSIDSNTSKLSSKKSNKRSIDSNTSKSSSKTIESDKRTIDSNTSKTPSKNLDSSKKVNNSNTSKADGDKKLKQKIIKETPSCDLNISKINDQTKEEVTISNKTANELKESAKTKSDETDKTKKQTLTTEVPKETIANSSTTKNSEGLSTKPDNIQTKDAKAKKSTSENTQKVKTIVKTEDAKEKKMSSDLNISKESLMKVIGIKKKEAKKISMSPKQSVKQKDKKLEGTSSKIATKANQQMDSKNEKEVAMESEKTKSTEIKTEQNAAAIKETKPDATKTNESKCTPGAIIEPEEIESSTEKTTTTTENCKTEKTEACVNQATDDKKQAKETETDKDELSKEELKIAEGKDPSLATEKTKIIESLNEETKVKEQSTSSIEKKGINKQISHGKTAVQAKSLITTDKDELKDKDKRASENLNIPVAEKETDPIETIKTKEQITKVQETSPKENIKEIAPIQDTAQQEKMEKSASVPEKNYETETLEHSAIEAKIKYDLNQTEKVNEIVKTTEPEEEAGKDVAINEKQDKIEIEKSEENADVKSKQNKNSLVKESSDVKLEDIESAKRREKKLKKPDNFVSLKCIAAKESEKIRTVMESVLQKSVVILLEPMKIIQNIGTNSENENIVEHRLTKSRLENHKSKDSKDEQPVDKLSEHTETTKPKEGEPSSSAKNHENDTMKNISEPMIKDTGLLSEATKSEIEVKKTPDICQDNYLTKELASPDEKESINVDHKKESEQEIIEATTIAKPEKVLNQISHDTTFEEEKGPIKKETNAEVAAENKFIQKEIEEENRKTAKTRKRSDLEVEAGKHKNEKPRTASSESKSSEEKKEGESKEPNVDPIKTRKRGDLKDEIGKGKPESSDNELSGEKKSKQRAAEEQFEPMKKRTRFDSKTENEKEKTESKQIVQQNEPIGTRKRNDPRAEGGKGKVETKQEPVKTRKPEISAKMDTTEPLKIKKPSEPIGKTETSQVQREHELIKTKRKRNDSKTEAEKGKQEIVQVKLSKEKDSVTTADESIKTKKRADISEVDTKQKREITVVKPDLAPVTTRKRSDLKEEIEKGKSSEKQDEIKAEDEKLKPNIAQLQPSNEKAASTKKDDEHKEDSKAETEKADTLQVATTQVVDVKGPVKETDKLIKTSQSSDLKAEVEVTQAQPPEDKSSAKKEDEFLKGVKIGDPKEETVTDIKQDRPEHAPVNTRKRNDSKTESGKEKTETKELEENNSAKNETDQIKTRKRGNKKEEAVVESKLIEPGHEPIKTRKCGGSIEESSTKSFDKKEDEPMKTRKRIDLKVISEKEKTEITEVLRLEEKSSSKKEETIKTRTRSDLKVEAVKEKTEIVEDETENKAAAKRGHIKTDALTTIANVEAVQSLIKGRKRGDPTPECEKEIPKIEASGNKSCTEIKDESIMTRKRSDLKAKSERVKTETAEVELEKQLKSKERGQIKNDDLTDIKKLETVPSPIRTRKRGDPTAEAKKEIPKIEASGNKSSAETKPDPVKSRKRIDLNAEVEKEKIEIKQTKSLEEKNSAKKDEKEKIEMSQEQALGESSSVKKEETEKEQMEIAEVESDKESRKPRKRGDPKGELLVETTKIEPEHEQIKTRKRGDITPVAEKETSKIKVVPNKSWDETKDEPIKTRKRSDLKAEAEKDKTATIQIKTSEEKSSAKKGDEVDKTEMIQIQQSDKKDEKAEVEQENEPRKTRKRGDLKGEAATEFAKIEPEQSPIKTRKRGDLTVECTKEISKTEGSDNKSFTEKRDEPVKTRKRGDPKVEIEKDKTEITQAKSSEEKSSAKKEEKEKGEMAHVKPLDKKDETEKEEKSITEIESENEPRKTRKRGDPKVETVIEITNVEREQSPMKTRRRADPTGEKEAEKELTKTQALDNKSCTDLKAEGEKEKNKIVQVKPLGDKRSAKKETDAINTRKRSNDLKLETEKEKAEITEVESENETRKTRRRADPKGEHLTETPKLEPEQDPNKAGKPGDPPSKDKKEISQNEASEHKTSTEKEDVKPETEKETMKVTQTQKNQEENKSVLKDDKKIMRKKDGDIKEEAVREIVQVEPENESLKSRKRGEPKADAVVKVAEVEPENETIKTTKREDAEKEVCQTKVSENKSSAEKDEPVKYRKRSDPKAEVEKVKPQITEAEPENEPIKTRKRGDTKTEAIVENTRGEQEHEPPKTRKRGSTTAEAGKDISQLETTDNKCPSGIEDESIKTKIRCDPKGESVTEISQVERKTRYRANKTETEKEKISDLDCSNKHEPIKTNKTEDLKPETVKEKPKTLQPTSSSEKSIVEENVDVRNEASDVATTDQTLINEKEQKSITTEISSDTNIELAKDKHEIKSSVEKSLVEHDVESKIKSDRADGKGEELKEKCGMPEKDFSSNTVDQASSDNKTATDNADKNLKLNCESLEGVETPVQTEENLSELVESDNAPADKKENTVSYSVVNAENAEKVISTADEKKSDEINSVVNDSESKQLELKTDTQIEKVADESLGSENETSGCESSSSNSEYTLRRALRKRGTDSPFPENENKKKTFKEPLVVRSTTAHITPKHAKIENPILKTLGSSSKRPLRSLDLATENPTSSKKIKLDTTKTPTRLRNVVHNDCLDEEELPVVSREQQHLQAKPAIVAKQKLNDFPKIIYKAIHIQQTKEVKETPKHTAAVSEKKVEEVVKDAEKLQSSVNVQQKEANKDASKQLDASASSKPIVGAKKATDSKEKKAENVVATSESSKQPKVMKTNTNTTPKKSPGSVVISFSDWLKTKNQNTITEVDDKAATTKETTSDIAKRQSRITIKPIAPKISQDKGKETSTEILKVTQSETMMCQNKGKDSVAEVIPGKTDADVEKGKISRVNDDESTHVSQQSDKSVLLSPGSQVESGKRGNKKLNVKRLQTSTTTPKKGPKIQTSPIKSNTETTSNRIKRSETALLIDAMPKEMKDGGINYLLETEKHVKRQRLPSRRKLNITTEQSRVTSPVTLKLNKSLPKVVDFSEYLEAPSSKDTNRSPTRRKAQQNSATSKVLPTMTRKEICSTPDHTTEYSKASNTNLRKSLNIRELPRQIEKTTNFAATGVKQRKSMPQLSRETLDKGANLSFRKPLEREQSELSESYVFKVPKLAVTSTVLNKIPTPSAESMKKIYANEIRRPESRTKSQQKDGILKKFKCRKLTVRLNRSIVEKYFKSINSGEKQISTRKPTVATSESEMPPTQCNNLAIIQNNSETSLRIQSVVDASTIHSNTSSSSVILGTQVAQPSTSNSLHDPNIAAPNILPGAEGTAVQLTTSIINPSNIGETIELKNEFVDENAEDSILPDTPTLLARAQTIKEAAQHALSNSVTPTDIRLLTSDPSENSFVPSFGVIPRALDNKGTCMYSFLHPAKYNRNHSNVLLDYCCPNLNGPMPAIDPTRIHAQVQVPVIELPASIVLTTKVVTRSDLENGHSAVPEIIRKKAEKIRKNMATHHKMAVTPTAPNAHATSSASVATPTVPNLAPRPSLPPTINALTKQLPSTTTITAKIRHPMQQPSQQPSPSGNAAPLTNLQLSSLRSSFRRFDVLLKQLVQPYENLTFVQRHHIIEALIASGKYLPKDLEQTLVLMEEYVKQTVLVKQNDSLNQPPAISATAIMSKNNYTASQAGIVGSLPAVQMPQLQPSPKMLASSVAPVVPNTYSSQFEQTHGKAMRKVQSKGKNTSSTSTAIEGPSAGVVVKQRQVPIYDTDRNIIGYQMQMTPISTIPGNTKSTISTHSESVMSTSLDSSSNKITEYHISKRPMKRPAQDSPRVFYTTPPLKTSTPKAVINPDVYSTSHHMKNANTISQKTQRQGSIITTVRSGSSSAGTITTTTMATVKRVTRSTATGSKLIIVSKSNQSSEETILPDGNNSQQHPEQTEIKNEKEDFLG